MEKNIRKKLKSTKGITLIALVITIIVLLILAGVSLSMVLSQDGIFSRAEQATDKYGQAKARETLELVLDEFQMTKYEEGLSGQNYESRLDNKIAAVGSLIPKDDEKSNYQLVIVDGHIFEIDRSVPKIVDYKGPADGVIITAQIKQSGWPNPTATVTGTITKYGGGSVANTIITATNGVTIPSDFPTTGGSYTIPNITTDTDITITTTDSEGEIVTKIVKIVLIKDTKSPTISDATAKATLMKITISARATDTESGLQELKYSISPNTIKNGKAEGTLTSGIPIEVEATAEGSYTITFTATDFANNPPTTATAGPVRASNAMSVEDAKRLVTSMSALKQYIGTKVDYKDGETWQIFYYDEEEKNADGTGKGVGYFGPANTLYLKKAYSSSVRNEGLTLSTQTSNTDPAVQMMRRMNPKWASSSYSAVDLYNEKACVWICDTSVWNSQRNATYSSYAIGSPSVEMFMRAYNVWKTGNKNANNLICEIVDNKGYRIGINGSWSSEYGGSLLEGIEAGPYSVFLPTHTTFYLWLGSPATYSDYYVFRVRR